MRESRWQQFDFVIVGCVLGLILAGVAMIHSATCGSQCTGLLPPSSYAVRQGLSAAVGFALLVGISLIDYRVYRVYAYHLYGFAVALLVLVLLIGQGGADADYGSKRWIYLGVFDLQASEVAKLAVLVAIARVLGDKPEGPLSFRRLMASLGLVIVPIGLVFAEPDLGTSFAFLMIWATMALVAGVRWRHAVVLALGGVAASPLVWLGMKDYMRERLMTFVGTLVDLEHAAFDEGYNVLQARISIGSGGLLGRGRGAWLHRRERAVLPVRDAAVQGDPRGGHVPRRLWPPADVRRRGHDPVRGRGQPGREPDLVARHRHPPAVHQLLSHVAADQPGRARHRPGPAVHAREGGDQDRKAVGARRILPGRGADGRLRAGAVLHHPGRRV